MRLFNSDIITFVAESVQVKEKNSLNESRTAKHEYDILAVFEHFPQLSIYLMLQMSDIICILLLFTYRYGQMTAGSYCYIGPQGIVHGTMVCTNQMHLLLHIRSHCTTLL